ncbi:MAG: STAS domain-containing protein [Actinomycetes bacterium]
MDTWASDNWASDNWAPDNWAPAPYLPATPFDGVRDLCEISRHPDGPVVRVSAEVDLSTSPQLKDALLLTLTRSKAAIVDLSGVRFFDSSGIHTLVSARRRAACLSGVLLLAGPSPCVLRTLTVSDLLEYFDIHSSLRSAIKAYLAIADRHLGQNLGDGTRHAPAAPPCPSAPAPPARAL